MKRYIEREDRKQVTLPENGVIFSDGMKVDYLQFTAGMEATVTVAASQVCLARVVLPLGED